MLGANKPITNVTDASADPAAVGGQDIGEAAAWGGGFGAVGGAVGSIQYQQDLRNSELQQTNQAPKSDTNLQAGIDEGYRQLSDTRFAKTERGNEIVLKVGELKQQGKIGVAKLDGRTRAQYDLANRKIIVNLNVDASHIPGRLAHEGSHAVWDAKGKIYGLANEKAAYKVGYIVDREMRAQDAYMPTDDQIRKSYGF